MKRAIVFSLLLALIPSAAAGNYMPPPGDVLPTWSPDGTRIAFLTTRGSAGYAVVGPDGSGETRLREGNPGVTALSPDWRRFADRRIDGALYVDDRLIARSVQPEFAWAPDSERLAFAGSSGLYVVRADGSGLVRVAEGQSAPDGGVEIGPPVWSPDGERIAYHRHSSGDQDVHLVRADGQGHVKLSEGDRRANLRPIWAPDGRSIVFVTSDGRNVTLELSDLGGRRRVLPVSVDHTNLEIAWFPDGRTLAVGASSGVLALDVVSGRKRTWL